MTKLISAGSNARMPLQLQNRWRENTHHYVRWTEHSRQVIRLYKPRLQQQLVLSPRCGHLKGNGGVKAAVRFAQRLTNHYAYVARFDIRHYYESIDHRVMLAQLRHVSPDVFDVGQPFFPAMDQGSRLVLLCEAQLAKRNGWLPVAYIKGATQRIKCGN